MAFMAMAPGEPPVISGKIQGVTVIIYDHGSPITTGELDDRLWPYQINNMDAWFQATIQVFHSRPVIAAYKATRALMEYVVNDGLGRKAGRGRHDNKFSYILRSIPKDDGTLEHDIRIDVRIQTLSHQLKYHREIKAGIRTPAKRTDPHIDRRTGFIIMPTPEFGEGMKMEYRNHEEFYAEHPEWRNKLPTR